jgi:hypothetical protein
MKGTRIFATTLAMLLVAVPSAFAATTTRVSSIRILALVFVGFLALVIVIQLMPAIMSQFGSLKDINKKGKGSETVKVEPDDKEYNK